MTRSVILPALLLPLAWAGALMADDSRLRRYELPDFDALEMLLPEGWQDHVDEQPGSAELTVELRPGLGAAFEAYVTPEANGQAPGRVQDADSLRESVRDLALRLSLPAGEVPEIRRLQGADGVGYYFVATDLAALPDGFRHLVQGALLAGGLVLRFEILVNDAADPAIAQALAMLQGAVHRDRGPGQP
ncbi:MAG TPA: hypothetical protein VFR29_05075 [Steroidobacteraceae bacterium]|nr:hypothetical protein [Steroidobacteraceae bacterium]